MLKCLVIEDHKDTGIATDIINQVIAEYSSIVNVSIHDVNYIKDNCISDYFDIFILIHDCKEFNRFLMEDILLVSNKKNL